MARTRTTPVQQRAVEEISARYGGKRVFTEQVGGASVVRQMRLYLEREDAGEIGEALYKFLMNRCGFIAHYGLVPPDGGFRLVYAEPAALIEEFLLNHQALRGFWLERGEPDSVFTDGMTDLEVYRQLLDLVVGAQPRADEQARLRLRTEEVRHAQEICDRWGVALEPNGATR